MKSPEMFIPRLRQWLNNARQSEPLARTPPVAILLLIVAIASYGWVIPRLGFYWDSWPMNWIAQTRGPQGLAQYFSTNRPVWGLLYQLTTSLLGGAPLPWQILALALRWLAALAFWWVLRLVWPRRPELAWMSALFFVVYPAFQQQSIGLLYTHFYLVMCAYLASLGLAVLTLRKEHRATLLWIPGILLSAANLLMMEYFFVLELLRPILLWLAAADQPGGWRVRLRRVLTVWAPYLVVFLAAIAWRAFFFPYQTNNYQMGILSQFASQPLQTLLSLLQRALSEIWTATGLAWIHALQLPSISIFGKINLILTLLVMAGIAILLFGAGLLWRAGHQAAHRERLVGAGQALLAAGFSLGLAGWPFWLTNVPFRLAFAYDRFTLPFIFGACLLFSGLILLLPWRPMRWAVLAGLVGLGAGFQFQTGLLYRQDWVNQQRFFWQLQQRVPALQPGTLVFANENKVTAFSTDNSLTAPLNWVYDPANASQSIQYLLVYPTIRVYENSPLKLETNRPVMEDLLVGKFEGNTSQSIALFYDGSACLHVIDPLLDTGDPAIPDDLKKAATFGSLDRIQDAAAGAEPSPVDRILGQPPANDWCQTYEKADLLRQRGQWYNIIQLWQDAGKDQYLQSRSARETVPFIAAFAHNGQWDVALALTAADASQARPVFCALWQQIDQTDSASPGKAQSVSAAMDKLRCSEYGITPSQP